MLIKFFGKIIMPYKIEKKGNGYMVCDKKRCFSNKPLSIDKARKQRVAIILSEAKGDKKKVSEMFI